MCLHGRLSHRSVHFSGSWSFSVIPRLHLSALLSLPLFPLAPSPSPFLILHPPFPSLPSLSLLSLFIPEPLFLPGDERRWKALAPNQCDPDLPSGLPEM